MLRLSPFTLSPQAADRLRGELLRSEPVIAFSREPKLAALIAAVGMQRELGTINDEMARFVYDADLGTEVARENIRAELVSFREWVGAKVTVLGVQNLELRVRGLDRFLHPHFSYRSDGSLAACVFFPELIARVLREEGVDSVVVNRWGMNTIFGGFDPATHYYQTNFWELENNDTLLFSRLIEKRELPFLGTHDLIAHLAGVRADAWPRLVERARQTREVLEEHFARIHTPSIASLVLPYTTGVVLDDLAQPPNYDSLSQVTMLEELLKALAENPVPPSEPRVLLRFPKSFQSTIELARNRVAGTSRETARQQVRELVREITHATASVR